jgi:hypothetical protein
MMERWNGQGVVASHTHHWLWCACSVLCGQSCLGVSTVSIALVTVWRAQRRRQSAKWQHTVNLGFAVVQFATAAARLKPATNHRQPTRQISVQV